MTYLTVLINLFDDFIADIQTNLIDKKRKTPLGSQRP